jgi:hypothetical protein
LGEGTFGIHEARGYATWVSRDKYFLSRPRERLLVSMNDRDGEKFGQG